MKRLIIVTNQGPHRPLASTWFLVQEQEQTRLVNQYSQSLDRPEKFCPLVALLTHLPDSGMSRAEHGRYAEAMARAVDVEAAALNVLQLWDDQYSHSADEEERSVWQELRDAMSRRVLP